MGVLRVGSEPWTVVLLVRPCPHCAQVPLALQPVISCPQPWLGASWRRPGHGDARQLVMGPPAAVRTLGRHSLSGPWALCAVAQTGQETGIEKALPAPGVCLPEVC